MKFAIKFRTQLIHSFGVTPFSHSWIWCMDCSSTAVSEYFSVQTQT
jgi:hypothetical protein